MASTPKVPQFVIRATDNGSMRALELLEPVLGHSSALANAKAAFANYDREQRAARDAAERASGS